MGLLRKGLLTAVLLAIGTGVGVSAQEQVARGGAGAAAVIKGVSSTPQATRPADAAPTADPNVLSEIGPAMNLVIGKSTLMRLPTSIERISLGNPAVADVTMISTRELYLLGKAFGSTNLIMWRKGGGTTIIDLNVSLDSAALESRLRELLPAEKGLRVNASVDAVVLSGEVSSGVQADFAVAIAETFVRNYSRGLLLPVIAGASDTASGQPLSITQGAPTPPIAGVPANRPRVINMMRVTQPQQVMLEVQVAEISKTLLDKLGVGLVGTRSNGDWRYSILSNFLTGSAGVLGAQNVVGDKVLNIDAEKKDGLIKILAEPNIVSISGQEASFLAGGKVFIPVSRANAATGVSQVTLEEKEFGVGLRFTPTVLDGGRINLKVAPEVSELSQTGSAFSTVGGQTSILPSLTTRRAQTTVQLMDGQSFAIAGLIKNNVTESMRRFPVLGEVPVLGALFRSSEFQNDRSELMFVVTPRLVKPLQGTYPLPTDGFVPPTRTEFFLKGQLEGSGSSNQPDRKAGDARPTSEAGNPVAPAASDGAVSPARGGYQLK